MSEWMDELYHSSFGSPMDGIHSSAQLPPALIQRLCNKSYIKDSTTPFLKTVKHVSMLNTSLSFMVMKSCRENAAGSPGNFNQYLDSVNY